jgi:hypothetical protein
MDFNSAYNWVDRTLAGGFLPGGAESPWGKLRRGASKYYNQLDKTVGGSLPGGIPPVVEESGQDVLRESPLDSSGKSRQTGESAYRPASAGSTVPSAGGGDSLMDIIRFLAEREEVSRGKLLDPEYQRFRKDLEVEAYRRMADIAQGAAMEKSRERSRREIELQNMRSWEAITRSQIEKEARLAESLARTAYIASTPNANVLSALAPVAQQSMAAYKQPQSVFPS